MNHEGIQGALVSHGSSTVPRYIVDEINALGGNIQNAYGISKEELKAAIPCGIGKINVDTDIRLAVTRNFRELFRDHPELKEDAKVGGIWKLLDEKRDAFDPRAFLAPIMDTVMYGTGDEGAVALITDAMRRGVKEAVGTLIVEFGSYGKAPRGGAGHPGGHGGPLRQGGLSMDGITLSFTDARPVLAPGALEEQVRAAAPLLAEAAAGEERYRDNLGWHSVDEAAGPERVDFLLEQAARVRADADAFVVIGIGGSNQASRAAVKALRPEGGPRHSVGGQHHLRLRDGPHSAGVGRISIHLHRLHRQEL